LILVWVETMVCENEYMPIHVAEIHSLDRGSSGPTAMRLIVVDTENSGVLRDGKVGMS
jgi:hypothetical protein